MQTRTQAAEARLERLDAQLQEAERKMKKAIADYGDARVAWAFQVVRVSEVMKQEEQEAESTAHI